MNSIDFRFQSGSVLEASQLNNYVIAKINELITNYNSITSGGTTTPGTGDSNYVTSAQVQQILSECENRTGLQVLKDKVALLVTGDETNGYKINKAGFFAAINDDSTVTSGIKSDYIIMDAQNTTLTGALNAMKLEVKNAVVEDLQAGDITVTGTLNYNQLVGNVVTVGDSDLWQIPSNATYVKIGSFSSSTQTVRLPKTSEISTGHTVFVESKSGVNILPDTVGNHLLAGWVYSHREEVGVGNGSDTETHYVYKWAITSYCNDNLNPHSYNLSGDYIMLGAPVHSYLWTGSYWVETTNLNLENKITLTQL